MRVQTTRTVKTRKPKREGKPGAWRTLNPYAPFTPGGEADASEKVFLDFWLAADARVMAIRRGTLRRDKARLARLVAARRKTEPVLSKLFRGEMPVTESAQALKRLVPDPGILRELFDSWSQAVKTTPEQAAEQSRNIARREAELARSAQWVKAMKAITGGLTVLVEGTAAGEVEAAKQLVQAGVNAAMFVGIAEKQHPEMMKTLARKQELWPVLAKGEAGWERETENRVRALGLGDEARLFSVRFRRARGVDANLPARQWAKAAVRTIENTQLRAAAILAWSRQFGSRGVFLKFLDQARWQFGPVPGWAREALGVKPFCAASLPEWKRMVRQMIREQIPAFHTRPEWATQRNSAAARGRDTVGELQNAILDDIGSALERIAPIKEMPKSAC